MLSNGTAGTATKRRTHFATGMFSFSCIAVNHSCELGTCSRIFPILARRNAQKDEIKGK